MVESSQCNDKFGTSSHLRFQKFCYPRFTRTLSMKGESTCILLSSRTASAISSNAMGPDPLVNKLLRSGDVETNPGPVVEDILKELRSFRADTVKQFEAMGLEMGTLKTDLTVVRDDVDETRGKLGVIVDEMSDFRETLDLQYGDLNTVHEHAWVVQEKIDRLEEAIEKQERYSRINNVILYGVEEHNEDDATKVVLSLLNEHVRNKTWSRGNFIRVHRLGRKSGKRQRPIIACLLSSEDKFLITSARSKLREKGIGVSNDYTHEQRGQLKRLKDMGRRGYYKGGKLYVEGHPNQKPLTSDQTSDCNTFYLKVNPNQIPPELDKPGDKRQLYLENNRHRRQSVSASEGSGDGSKFYVANDLRRRPSASELNQPGGHRQLYVVDQRLRRQSVSASERSGSCSKLDVTKDSRRGSSASESDQSDDNRQLNVKDDRRRRPSALEQSGGYPKLSMARDSRRRTSASESDKSVDHIQLYMEYDRRGRPSASEQSGAGGYSKLDGANESPRRPSTLALDLSCGNSKLNGEAESTHRPSAKVFELPNDNSRLYVGDSPRSKPSASTSDLSCDHSTLYTQAGPNHRPLASVSDVGENSKLYDEPDLSRRPSPSASEQSGHHNSVSFDEDRQRVPNRRHHDNDGANQNFRQKIDGQRDDQLGARRKSKGSNPLMHQIHKLFSSSPRKAPDLTIRN